ncbi:MAG: CRISPR-associated protein Cas5 [Thermosphaera sp.]
MKAHVFSILFFTAHFRRHETRKFRSSYLLPPPTVIWGFLGAAFGVEREKLSEFVRKNGLAVGAELHCFKGLAFEKATLMPWDKERGCFARTVEDFEFIVEPHFKVGVYGKDDFVDELRRRIERRDFEFDIYGGISDCFLKDIRNEDKGEFAEERRARGMIPVSNVAGISHAEGGGKVVEVLYFNTFFYQGFRVEFITRDRVKTVNGIAVWGVDDVERFRKGNLD